MPRSPARPTARAGASTARSATSFPARATSATPSIAPTLPGCGASDRAELPQPGVDAYEIFRKIDRGEIQGLLSICFNPLVSLPDNNFVARMLEKLEFYVAIDFFLNETAHHADIVLPGSLQEEDEGIVTQIEGRVIKINKAVDPPGEARQDWRIIQDIAAALGRAQRLHVRQPARDLRRAAARVEGRHRRLLRHHLREDRAAARRLLAVPERRSSRHAAAVRARFVEPDRPGRRAVLLPRRQGALQRRPVHAAGRRRRRRVPDDADDGPRRQPVSFRHADAADRSAGRSVSRAAHRDAPAAGRAAWASPTATGSTVETRRGKLHAARAGGRRRFAPTRSSFPITGPAARAPTS